MLLMLLHAFPWRISILHLRICVNMSDQEHEVSAHVYLEYKAVLRCVLPAIQQQAAEEVVS